MWPAAVSLNCHLHQDIMQAATQCRVSHHGVSCSARPQARTRMHIAAHHVDRKADAVPDAAAGASRRGVLGLGAALLATAAQQHPFLVARADEVDAAVEVQQVGWARGGGGCAAAMLFRCQPCRSCVPGVC